MKVRCEYFKCKKSAKYQVIEYYNDCYGTMFKLKVCADHLPSQHQNDITHLWDSNNFKSIKEIK